MNSNRVQKAKFFAKYPIKSDKPFATVIKESLGAAFVSIIFFIITLIITAFMDDNWGKFKEMITWRDIFLNFVLVGFATAAALEYSGLNKILCKSSMKYYDRTWKKAYDSKKSYKKSLNSLGADAPETKELYIKYRKARGDIEIYTDS